MKIRSLAILLLLISCGTADTGATDSTQGDLNQNLETRTVTITTSAGPVQVTAEVADSSEERRIGLMNRQSLGEHSGMLFLFDTDTQNPFWMRDTYVSLDILFIDASDVIVTIARDTTPLSEERITSSEPYRTVLEVNSGFSDRNGIAVGDRVSY